MNSPKVSIKRRLSMQLIETHIAYQIQNLQQKAIYKQKIISYFILSYEIILYYVLSQ